MCSNKWSLIWTSLLDVSSCFMRFIHVPFFSFWNSVNSWKGGLCPFVWKTAESSGHLLHGRAARVVLQDGPGSFSFEWWCNGFSDRAHVATWSACFMSRCWQKWEDISRLVYWMQLGDSKIWVVLLRGCRRVLIKPSVWGCLEKAFWQGFECAYVWHSRTIYLCWQELFPVKADCWHPKQVMH